MAKRKQKLKVFKTPIGFHDAYVAAPSRKAALAAWGAGTDLFSAGIAEEVKNEPRAMKSALAKPGEVVRQARAGGKDSPLSSRPAAKPRSKAKARPTRSALDEAEAALAALEKKQAAENVELDREEARQAKRRRAMEERHARAIDRSEARLAAVKERYRQALARWAG